MKRYLQGIVLVTVLVVSAVATVLAAQPYEDMTYDLEVVSASEWEDLEVGEYPLTEKCAEWSSLSYSEILAACDMPADYAKSLTTEELVAYALNYPLLLDMILFDDFSGAMNHFADTSTVFAELFEREDCLDELVDSYLRLTVDYEAVTALDDLCSTNYDAELFVEVYVGLNYESLSKELAQAFVEEYGKKYVSMNEDCQDSVYATFFLEAIEESLGTIPESAIPNTIAEKLADIAELVDETDATVASVASTSSFVARSTTTCSICSAIVSYGTMTVKGKTVYCYKWISGGICM